MSESELIRVSRLIATALYIYTSSHALIIHLKSGLCRALGATRASLTMLSRGRPASFIHHLRRFYESLTVGASLHLIYRVLQDG